MLALHKQKILHTLTMQAKDTQKLSPQFCQETTKKKKKNLWIYAGLGKKRTGELYGSRKHNPQ